jgi:sugar transport protein
MLPERGSGGIAVQHLFNPSRLEEMQMTTAEFAVSDLSDVDHRKQLRRAVVASAIGTTIEWYDFFIYGIVTGLVFAKLYFPTSDQLVGTLQAYAVFFVGFVARPVGAAIFGHYGDRIGRKSTLIVTLLLTDLAAFAVALAPSYEQIGIWGASAADRATFCPRGGGGRRVERLGAAVDGMGEDQRASWLHRPGLLLGG